MGEEVNNAPKIIITILCWPSILLFLVILVDSTMGGHGPQLIVIYLAPILAVTGIATHIYFLQYQKKRDVILRFLWLRIGGVALLFYMISTVVLLLSLGGANSEGLVFYLILAIYFGVLPSLLIPLFIEKVFKDVDKNA